MRNVREAIDDNQELKLTEHSHARIGPQHHHACIRLTLSASPRKKVPEALLTEDERGHL